MSVNLTRGSVLKNLVSFSLPFLLSYFLQSLYGLADLFIIGQYNDAQVITAVSVGSQIMHMVTVIIVGLAMGSSVLIGRAVGADDSRRLSKTTGNTVTLFVIVAAIFTMILLACCPFIINIMSVPEESVEETKSYLYICFAGIPCIVAYNIIASIFRGMGDSKRPMIFIATACFFNIVLDYVFIGVFEMKAFGAAAATVLAQLLSVIVSFIAIKKQHYITLKKSDLKYDRNTFFEILRIGVPVACQDGFIQVSFLLITIMANRRGVIDAAAVGIVEKIIGFLFLVPSSMLSSISAVASQNIGAGNHENAKKSLFYGAAIAAGIGFAVAITFQFIAEPFIGLFTDNKEVVKIGSEYIHSYVFDCALGGIQFSFSGFFCAYGKSMYAFVHNVCAIILMRVPGAYFASVYYTDTLFPMGMAATLGSLISSVICVIFFIHMKRSKKYF